MSPVRSLLLCSNGSAASEAALEYGEWLVKALQLPATILGVVEARGKRGQVKELVDRTLRRLEDQGLSAQGLLREGRAETVIPETAAHDRPLTIVGPLGRSRIRRLATGTSFRRLLASIASPVLFVPVSRIPIRRLLVCAGGLAYTASLEQLSFALARALGASVVLLHIVEPVTLDYPLAKEIEAHWQTLLDTDTPQARHLRQAIEAARAAGLTIEFKVRRGSPVREILAELQSGDYDLVGLGSLYSARGLRRLALPNVTAEVAEAAHCPVLTVRYEQPG